jgi:hypothetical protein
LATAIDSAIRTVAQEVPDEQAPTDAAPVPPDEALQRLETDRTTVERHSRVADQPVTYGQASFCRECGEPAPCPTIRDLAERYGCADV